MQQNALPSGSQDINEIPGEHMPDVIRGLIAQRSLSALVREVHREMASADPELRHEAEKALRHLGFPD